jgi:hypothetical protein
MVNEEIIQNFEKQADGAWVCVTETVIETLNGPVTIEPGRRFGFGDPGPGVDIAEYLEQLGVQFGS